MPERIQRRRAKGWRMPDNAVYVGRPSKWGNPFRVERAEYADHFCYRVTDGRMTRDHIDTPRQAHQVAVDLFALHTGLMGNYEYDDETLARLRRELAGRDLACWCPLSEPCHADVLLEIAAARHGEETRP